MFCKNCGKQLADDALMCPNCGSPTAQKNVKTAAAATTEDDAEVGERSWLVSLLLCFFLGGFGAQSFYNGKMGIGIIQLLTAGGCGIWTLYDLIMIAMGKYRDADGKALKR